MTRMCAFAPTNSRPRFDKIATRMGTHNEITVSPRIWEKSYRYSNHVRIKLFSHWARSTELRRGSVLDWSTAGLPFSLSVEINSSNTTLSYGAIHCYVTQQYGMGGCPISQKKRYEDVRLIVISITRGVGGCQISRKQG